MRTDHSEAYRTEHGVDDMPIQPGDVPLAHESPLLQAMQRRLDELGWDDEGAAAFSELVMMEAKLVPVHNRCLRWLERVGLPEPDEFDEWESDWHRGHW